MSGLDLRSVARGLGLAETVEAPDPDKPPEPTCEDDGYTSYELRTIAEMKEWRGTGNMMVNGAIAYNVPKLIATIAVMSEQIAVLTDELSRQRGLAPPVRPPLLSRLVSIYEHLFREQNVSTATKEALKTSLLVALVQVATGGAVK